VDVEEAIRALDFDVGSLDMQLLNIITRMSPPEVLFSNRIRITATIKELANNLFGEIVKVMEESSLSCVVWTGEEWATIGD